jgi:amino acid adenylation domain-containing protein
LVESAAAQTPDAIAVEHLGSRLSYQELNLRANQLASVLRNHGVGPEVIVGIGLQRSLELPIAILGVLKAGGACLPLDPKYPADRLAFMQQDAQAPVLITQPGLEATFAGSHAQMISISRDWSRFYTGAAEETAGGACAANLAYVIYTSGSTGKPRGVLLSHRNLVSYIVEAVELYGMVHSDRVVQLASLSFDIAIEEIFPVWATGGTVVLWDDRLSLGTVNYFNFLERNRISMLSLPTAFWHELVHGAAALGRDFPSSLRLVIVGGEKVSAGALASWRKMVGPRIRWMNTYGPSEASVITTAWEPSEDEEVDDPPIGGAVANATICLLDPELKPVPAGKTGELYIGGAGVARGYLNRPEITAERFIPDPFRTEPGAILYKTGDLARMRPDGNLEFRGRVDFQVKIRGFRVEVEEIERALDQHPGVREAAVVAQGVESKRLVAFVTTAEEPAPRPAELIQFLKDRLPEFMIPAAVIPLRSMPMSPNGKIDRRVLGERDLEPIESQSTRPKDETEATLLNIWRDVLGAGSIGVRDNFFEYGGDSLSAVCLMDCVQAAFHKNVPLATLLHAPTVEQFAEDLRTGKWARGSLLVPMQPLGNRSPLFLVHGVGGHVLRFRTLADYMAPEQPVYALQAQGLDGLTPPLRRVEEMAERYLDEVRLAQPNGPYHLAGYSFGGFVAVEMARRLLHAGREVSFLALLDTIVEKHESRMTLLSRFLKLPLTAQFEYLQRKIRKQVKRSLKGMRLPAELQLVRRYCAEAERGYRPPAYPGRIDLFVAMSTSLQPLGVDLGGWRGVAAGGVGIHEVPGDHGSIVDEPNARILAQRLLARLDEIQPRRTASA